MDMLQMNFKTLLLLLLFICPNALAAQLANISDTENTSQPISHGILPTSSPNDDKLLKNSALTIPYADLTATIDGELSDEIWQRANTIDLNIVNAPWNNKPSPIKTLAKIVENGEFLYVAFIADDPNPENIIAALGDRDSRWDDDRVLVKLDTSNSRRLNYEFSVNSLGVQMDRITNEMTSTSSSAWNGIWDSYGKQTEQGYQVEMAIPYRILNFDDSIDIKTWAIELIRSYPRDTSLRISHIKLDRDNNCYLCQAPELTGFRYAKASNNIMLTPTIVANRDEQRDLTSDQDWQSANDTEASLDIRWGINSNTLFNATINPDYSTIETDSLQLSVNNAFALYYDEKRPFFLENADYFSSDYNLVYTRNIVDPDYGAKLTGTNNEHSYGMFVSHDNQTQFFLPSSTNSSEGELDDESYSAALKYRYDLNADLSFGAISTLRTADDYHNYVVGLDSNYRINDSNTIKGQIVNSNTEHKAVQDSDFSDQAYKLSYLHNSEYWQFDAVHQSIGKKFRADLGYITRNNIKDNSLSLKRLFYWDDDSLWPQAKISGQYQSKYTQKNELLEESFSSGFEIYGPMLSVFDISLIHAEKVGYRQDTENLDIKDNTSLFTEKQINFYGQFQPTPQLFSSLEITYGDQIDYDNNRLGDLVELSSAINYSFNQHLELDAYLTRSELDFNSENVYVADLVELRLSYQFDVYSYLKLNLAFRNTDRNLANNTDKSLLATDKNFQTQLIYAYKLNPQTVFFLGYSDNSYQDDDLVSLKRDQRTLFTKVSYAWMP